MKHRILLGLTGSVATVLYKKLIKELSLIGDVDVLLTERAKHFIDMDELNTAICVNGNMGVIFTEDGEWTWFDSEMNPVHRWSKDYPVLHIQLRDRSSALVIAPCSANTMAKLAYGFCDNLLSTVARAWDVNRPVIIAPAMNTHMWEHPHTIGQLQILQSLKYTIVPPQEKMLACGTYGMGAMAEISRIGKAVEDSLRWSFPLPDFESCSGIPTGNHPGAFSTQRKHEKHTGVDLYIYEGAFVKAVEDGIIVGRENFTGEWDKSPWWNNTECVLVEGATGVVCYGEINPQWYLKPGDRVKRGDSIGSVLRVLKEGKDRPDIPGHKTSMLHLELYPHGTTKASNGFEDHLQDPTPFLLDSWEGKYVKVLTV